MGTEVPPLSDSIPGAPEPSKCGGALLRPAPPPACLCGPARCFDLWVPVCGGPGPWARVREVGRAPGPGEGLPGTALPYPTPHPFTMAMAAGEGQRVRGSVVQLGAAGMSLAPAQL